MTTLSLRHRGLDKTLPRCQPFHVPEKSKETSIARKLVQKLLTNKHFAVLTSITGYAALLSGGFFVGKLLGHYASDTDYDAVSVLSGCCPCCM